MKTDAEICENLKLILNVSNKKMRVVANRYFVHRFYV